MCQFIKKTWNISLKVPRLDRCSKCWAITCCIEEETDDKKKKSYEKLLKNHQKDAFMTRDYIYSTFLKSMKEHGRATQDLDSWEEWEMD